MKVTHLFRPPSGLLRWKRQMQQVSIDRGMHAWLAVKPAPPSSGTTLVSCGEATFFFTKKAMLVTALMAVAGVAWPAAGAAAHGAK